MDLAQLTDRQLVDLGCELNNGTFGRDPARMNKLDKMAYIRDLAPKETVEATAARILWENGKDVKPPADRRLSTHAPGEHPEDELDPALVAGVQGLVANTPATCMDCGTVQNLRTYNGGTLCVACEHKRANTPLKPQRRKRGEPQPQTVTGEDAVAAMLLHAVQAACSVVPPNVATEGITRGDAAAMVTKALDAFAENMRPTVAKMIREEIAKAFQVKA